VLNSAVSDFSELNEMIGILVIGSTPRVQLMRHFRQVISERVDIRMRGILDDLTLEERRDLVPRSNDDVLFAVLSDGSDVRLSHAGIARLAPGRLAALSDEGCAIVLFCCTGEFPELENQPYLLPARLLTSTVCAIVGSQNLGVFVPLVRQSEMARRRWNAAGIRKVFTVPLSPSAAPEEIEQAAQLMTRHSPDYVVYDCMSYGLELRRKADSVIDRPSVLSVSLVAHILAELASC